MATTVDPIDNSSSLTASQKVVATILGVVVIVFFVLLIVGVVRLVKKVQLPGTTKAPTVATSDQGQNITQDKAVIRENTSSYSAMPTTGPREDMMFFLGFLMVSGLGAIVVSKKFF